MNILSFLFEIGDKIIQVPGMYLLFISLGVVGFILGFWRWWLSASSLIFVLFFALMQVIETHDLYYLIVNEVGGSYIWHSYTSIIIGILLNVLGISINIFRTKEIVLQ